MKLIRIIFLTVMMILIAVGCTSQLSVNIPDKPKSITVVMDNNYPPYVFLDEKGKLKGILVDIWALWSQKTGVEAKLTGEDWGQALGDMETGKYDVIDTIFITDERQKIFIFTKPYATIEVPIYFNQNISGISNVNDLAGFRVAVKDGDAAVTYLLNNGVSDLSYYPSYESIIKAAQAGKESIFLTDLPPTEYFLYKYGIQDNFRHSNPLYIGEFHRAVIKTNQKMMDLVNLGFQSISKAEEDEIYNRWTGSNSILPDIRKYFGLVAAGFVAIVLIIIGLYYWNRLLTRRVKARTNDLEQMMHHLKENENRLRIIFNSPSDMASIITDLHLDNPQIIEFSRGATRIFGYEKDEIIGKSLFSLIKMEYADYLKSRLSELVSEGTLVRDNISQIHKEGYPFPTMYTAYPILDTEGKIISILHVSIDQTDIIAAENKIISANQDLFAAYDRTLEGWSYALELRERETAGHSKRVVDFTLRLAQELGISGNALEQLRRGALLHDIGKMGIPDSILLKPGGLDPDEWVVMKQHPNYAYQLIKDIQYLKGAIDIPYCHHERWDGSGYPRGLKGKSIPLPARIFAVVDVWDALLSDRPYRKAWPIGDVLVYIKKNSGSLFDPKVVEIFINMVEKELPGSLPE